MIILALTGLVLCVVGGIVFWLWFKVTDGEIGPALVATAISIVIIVGAMFVAIKIQEPREEGSWLRERDPAYASAQVDIARVEI
jgi:hypothetical protein